MERSFNGDEVSRIRFQAHLLDVAGQAVVATDLGGKIVYWNNSAERIYGWTAQEAVGRSVEETLVSDELRERAGEIMAELKSGNSWSGEFTVTRRDGTPCPVLVFDTPVYDGDGELVGVVGVSADITERKRAEETLRESEERFRAQYQGSPVPTFSCRWDGEDFVLTDYNEAAIEMTRGAVTDIVGKRIGELYADRPEVLEWFSKCFNERTNIKKEMWWTSKTIGDTRYFIADYVFVPPDTVMVHTQDLTERKLMEEELHVSREFLSSILENATTPIYIVTVEGRMQLVNRAYENLFGVRREGLIGSLVEEIFPPEMARRFGENNHQILETKSPAVVEFPVDTPGGRRDLQVVKFPLYDSEGRVDAVGGIAVDVTERRRAERELRESEERLRTIIETEPECVKILDAEGRVLQMNPAGLAMLEADSIQQLRGKPLPTSLVIPEHRSEFIALTQRVLGGESGRMEFEIVGLKGTRRWLETSATPLWDAHGSTTGLLGVTRDITRRKEAEDALRRSEEEYRELFENHPQPMWVFDVETLEFLAVNRAAVAHYGYAREEFLSMTIADIRPAEDYDRLREVVRIVSEGPMYLGEWRHRKKDGTVFDVEISLHGTFFEGRPAQLVQATDITERKVLEDQLAHQAFHDSLTGLPNRALFTDRLEHALAGIGRSESSVAVLFADLDNFKAINDSFGHETGDQLLVSVAERLRTCLRPEDTLARFGGDEFVILLSDVRTPSDVVRVASRVAEALREPFGLGGREVFVSASIGISLEQSEEALPEIVLRNADTAMYQAKGRDGVSYEIFEPGMYARVLGRLEMESDLRRALDEEQLRVHYQPQVGLRSGRIVGMEALVRWDNPERGLVGPAEFIPLAEETGLIVPLGKWVLGEACRQARAWHSEHPEAANLEIAVNLSLRQFQDPGLVDEVADALRRSGLDPRCMLLEITETVAMKDAELTTTVLHELKKLGVQLVIDDFGKGHSSLTYLIKRFHMDLLKIDRSFVVELARDSDYETIVSGITGIARSLNLRVVAEGIETAEQYAQVRNMGCDTGQGFYFSRPVPREEASALLEAGVRW